MHCSRFLLLLLCSVIRVLPTDSFPVRSLRHLQTPPWHKEGNRIETELEASPTRMLKIGNGDSVRKNATRFPYAVLLTFMDRSTDVDVLHVCTGVLFRSRWVLTAASCVSRVDSPVALHIGIGDNSPKPEELVKQEEAILVHDVITHPNFNGDPRDGADLALLYMKQPSNNTLPRFPTSEREQIPGDGTRLVGLGWGVTDVNSNFADNLQVADRFLFTNHEDCYAAWDVASSNRATIDNGVICVRPSSQYSHEASMSICDGDEGGPLVFLDTDSFDANSRFTFDGNPRIDIVYGIASFGPNRCGAEEFSIFTNLAVYMDWIEDVIEDYMPMPMTSTTGMAVSKEDMQDIIVILVPIIGALMVLLFGFWLISCASRRRQSDSSSAPVLSPAVSTVKKSGSRPLHLTRLTASPFLGSGSLSSRIGTFSSTDSLRLDLDVTLTGHKIGAGAFGRVEEGLYIDERGLKHRVAVKTIQVEEGEQESRNALTNEIRILERVGRHPNIVHCFGARLCTSTTPNTAQSIEGSGGCYIVLELMATDLEKLFKNAQQRKKITFQKCLEIFRGAANGLEYLHQCEVIHFDLKPSNILLDDNGQSKVADFGCSRKRTHSYITARAGGTLAYMAPELSILGLYATRGQVRGEKADVFSFGVVMWEAITNRRPVNPLSLKNLFTSTEEQEETEPIDIALCTVGTNDDFQNDLFPFESDRCPEPLKELIWECVSYQNDHRPSFREVKERIGELLRMEWVGLNIDQYTN